MGTTDNIIEPSVRKNDRIRFDYVLEPLAPALPGYAPHFEDIGKVGGKTQPERNIDCTGPIVNHLELLIADALPQKFGSQHVQRVSRNDHRSVP